MDLVPQMPSERAVRAVTLCASAVVCVVVGGASLDVFGVACAVVAVPLAWLLVRPIFQVDAASRVEGALDRFECVAVVAGRTVFVAGLGALLAHASWVRLLGASAVVAAIALLALALVRDRARLGFLERVYAREHPTFRVERDADVRGWELLPPVLSGTITDAVIAHVDAAPASYRTSDGPRPLARVTSSLTKMTARLERRTRLGGLLAAGLACAASLALMAPAAPAAPRQAPLVAPECRDAVPYFEDRLESLPGVTRATLLTHAVDPSVAEGHGVVLVAARPPASGDVPPAAPASPARTLRNALALARGIPCSHPLELTVEEPRYRRFDVRAELALEPGADADATVRDAETEVRALFEPGARAVASEPVRFGVEEKSFGYRVRYALGHVVGVRAVRLAIDGSDRDVPLAPRDFPTLGSLAVSVAK